MFRFAWSLEVAAVVLPGRFVVFLIKEYACFISAIVVLFACYSNVKWVLSGKIYPVAQNRRL
jgi:hypothetical protein